MSQIPPAGAGRRRFKWLIPLIAIAAVLLLLVLPIVGSYNGLVTKRNAVKQQFSNIDVQLQRRYDLIPNLVNAVKAALGQEQQVFGEIANARTRYAGAASQDEKVAASNELGGAISRLLVIVENYPQLQSNQTIRDLMTQVEGTENRISQERRLYNDVATTYNNAIQTFPRNITAGIFGFDEYKLIEAAPQAQQAPTVDLGVQPATPAPTASVPTAPAPTAAR